MLGDILYFTLKVLKNSNCWETHLSDLEGAVLAQLERWDNCSAAKLAALVTSWSQVDTLTQFKGIARLGYPPP